MTLFAKVHIMHTGEVTFDRSLAFKELDIVPPVGIRGEAFQLRVPISSYFVEHPRGYVVIDAGWHEEIRTNPNEHLGEELCAFIRFRLPTGSSIREQLAAKHISPSEIDTVVISHLDVDHISGLQLLSGAKRFLVSQLEWQNHADASKAKWINDLPIETFSLEEIPHGPFQRGKDLFGDGLIYLVHTPGHTAGHLSVLIRVQKGWVLLASDVGYAERSWQELILPGFTVDDKQAMQSLQWVQQFSQRNDCILSIANHDPSVKPMIL